MLKGGDTGQLFAGNGHNDLVHELRLDGTVLWCGWGEASKHSTLLGPEGTTESRHCAVRLGFQCQARLRLQTCHVVVFGAFVMVLGWSLVENCTVDASILFSVVKLSRANGGCLGTRSR